MFKFLKKALFTSELSNVISRKKYNVLDVSASKHKIDVVLELETCKTVTNENGIINGLDFYSCNEFYLNMFMHTKFIAKVRETLCWDPTFSKIDNKHTRRSHIFERMYDSMMRATGYKNIQDLVDESIWLEGTNQQIIRIDDISVNSSSIQDIVVRYPINFPTSMQDNFKYLNAIGDDIVLYRQNQKQCVKLTFRSNNDVNPLEWFGNNVCFKLSDGNCFTIRTIFSKRIAEQYAEECRKKIAQLYGLADIRQLNGAFKLDPETRQTSR